MKKLISIFQAILLMTCVAGNCFAECEEAKELISIALINPPDGMTEEYIQMGIELCKDKSDLLKQVAKYYGHWFKAELNPEKQAQLKTLAQHYYRKAIENGNKSKEMKTALAKLERDRDFNVVAFRALRPSSAGKAGSGLDLKVHFKTNSFKLSDTAQDNLNTLGRILAESQSIKISVEGHTDRSGSKSYNQELSLKRAESVQKYLISMFTIKPDRIHTAGHGFRYLAAPDNPMSKANRRVEVIKLN